MNKILFTILFSFSLVGFSQTTEQISKINKTYDFSEIEKVRDNLLKLSQQEKKEIEDYSKKNNLPITYLDSTGNLVIMEKIFEGKPLYLSVDNVQSAFSTRTNWLFENQLLNYNLQGEGLTAFVWDSGHARPTHQDFENDDTTSKITIGEGAMNLVIDSHSTHVTGILAGTGTFNKRSRGMAKKTQIKAYDFVDAEIEASNELGSGILISNHSYGFSSTQIQNMNLSNLVGAYMDRSRNWDLITSAAPYYLPVTSAGNDGTFAYNDDPLDPINPEYDKLSGMKTSKNVLVVANANTAEIDPTGELISVDINTSSSQGPTDDLRIKPDITGVGTLVFSTESSSDSDYGYKTGTSMASPNVSGTLVLLQELYEQKYAAFMKASSLKGLVMHTADDAGMVGPDAIYGWGLLNAKKAAETIQKKEDNTSIILEDNLLANQTYSINVNSNEIQDLEISISWTDPAGVINTTLNDPTPALVNDLNLEVTQGASVFLPWKLTGVNTNTKAINNVDPFEKIEIANASGQYNIEITHTGTLTGGEQNFSLIVTGISANAVICSPVQNLSETSVNATSHDFSWNASLDEINGYDWAIVEAGKNPDDHSIIQQGTVATNITSLSVTNLSPATNYSLFVKTNCSLSESEWNTIAFSTPCGTITQLPFFEDFTSTSSSYNCWAVDAVTTAFWATSNAGTNIELVRSPHSGDKNMIFSPNASEELGFVSPYFDASSFGNVKLSFYFVQQEFAGNKNELKVFFEELGNPQVEIAHLTSTYSDWTEIVLPLTTTSTPFRIILKGISNGGPNSAVDSFSINYDGYHFQDWVWKPRNPENLISSLSDDIWVENKTAILNNETLANNIEIDAGAVLEVADILEIDQDISGGGLLKFINNETQLGQIATLPISSNITVNTQTERWIPAGNENTRAFRMLSSPINSTTSIYENWQENGSNTSGFGTHITGSTIGANGFDATLTGNPSLYLFDHTSPTQTAGVAWDEIDNTDVNTISSGKAYRLFIRGDRTIDLTTNTPTPTNTKIRTSGNLLTGNFDANLAVGNAQFSSVGNPYQAIVDANLITYGGNINNNYIYIWDPNLNSNGGFVSVETSTGDHATVSEANQFIQPGQVFFIRNDMTVTSTPTLSFTESSKSVDQNTTQVFTSEAIQVGINLSLFNSNEEIDAIGLRFHDNYNNSFNDEDAGKMANTNENLAIIGNNKVWSFVKKEPLQDGERIPLFINNYTETQYKFIPEITSAENDIKYYLEDHYLNTKTELVNGEAIVFKVDSNSPESTNAFRFEIVSNFVTLSSVDYIESEILLYPNPVSDELYIQLPNSANQISIEVFDILGKRNFQQQVNSANNELQLDLNQLSSGLYILKVKSKDKQWVKKFIKR